MGLSDMLANIVKPFADLEAQARQGAYRVVAIGPKALGLQPPPEIEIPGPAEMTQMLLSSVPKSGSFQFKFNQGGDQKPGISPKPAGNVEDPEVKAILSRYRSGGI